jgi:hypothetical protein
MKKFFYLLVCVSFMLLGGWMIKESIPILTKHEQQLSPEISQIVNEVIAKRGYKSQEDLHKKGQIGAIAFLLIGVLNVGFFGYVAYRLILPAKNLPNKM